MPDGGRQVRIPAARINCRPSKTPPAPTLPSPHSFGKRERACGADLPIGWPSRARAGGVNLGAGGCGGVDLGAVFPGENVAAYAMTFVYSSSPRDVVLLFGIDDSARVLFNGREILRVDDYCDPETRAVPVTLQSGRNVILAKIANRMQGYSLHLRIGDSHADFARGYAQANQYDRAYDAYTKAVALEPENGDRRLHLDLGGPMAETGRWKEAKVAFERVLAPAARRLGPTIPARRLLHRSARFCVLSAALRRGD